jgi:GT2 family glycosyltransferase
VILTFNRPDQLIETVRSVAFVAAAGGRVVIVDNGNDPDLGGPIEDACPGAMIIRSERNIGVGARNLGLKVVDTEYAVTLDDDVRGLGADHLAVLRSWFEERSEVGAICFKVVSEDDPERVINWCHHRKIEEFANRSFVTYEISEGAVALRMSAVRQTKLYPEEFFISHEGPALAVQLMNRGFEVWYCPQVTVRHAVAQSGRPGWRRYYFDTRNVIWLAAGYFPAWMGLLTVMRGVGGVLVYSLRDGFFKYWLKGLLDGMAGLRAQLARRHAPTPWTKSQLKLMERARPGLLYLLKRRLFRRGVQI